MTTGATKKEYFQPPGLKIHVLWEVPIEQKRLSSSDIRDLMRKDKKWGHFVPNIVAKLMRQWNIAEKLKEIRSK